MCYNNAREQGCVVYAERYPYEPDLGKTSVGSSRFLTPSNGGVFL